VTSRDLGAITLRDSDNDLDPFTDPVLIALNDNHSAEYRYGNASVKCRSGEQAISGGADWTYTGSTGDGGIITVTSEPHVFADGRSGWLVRGGHDTGENIILKAWVLCLAA
jgi:hypothetical protein